MQQWMGWALRLFWQQLSGQPQPTSSFMSKQVLTASSIRAKGITQIEILTMSNMMEDVASAAVSGTQGLIGTLIGKVMIGVVLILITLLGASSYLVYYLREENQRQTATLASNSLQLEQSKFQIARLQTSATSTQLFANAVNEQLNVIRADQSNNTEKLESHRDKASEEAVRKKPTIVERRINSATNSVFNDLECATGGKCGRNTAVPSGKTGGAKP